MSVVELGQKIKRRPTRAAHVADLIIGAGQPVSVQSMCTTRTQDVRSSLEQIRMLQNRGADIIRVAVDNRRDVECLAEIRRGTDARLAVDLQENYRLAREVAPYVQKIRYNPGHLHHLEKGERVFDKVRFLVDCARAYRCALRIGVNCGSIDPSKKGQAQDPREAALSSAREHVGYLYELGFENFVVSLKSSDPNDVVELNRRFSDEFPEVPLHLGVTEAGMLPAGEIKSRIAFEQLLAGGIGDTLRVSLTLPFDRKYEEVEIGRRIIDDVQAGRFRSVPRFVRSGLNLISCPSCSRVENEKFVELAEQVREVSRFAAHENITIAVMGCRVNGPGESDDADIGLWCAPKHVNLKRSGELVGAFPYDEILAKVRGELETLLAQRARAQAANG